MLASIPARTLNPIRSRRGIPRFSLFGKCSNLSQGYISDVETGRRKGTAAALRLIADTLKVPLDLLVPA
jgi:transcriptional regulator with XRE-family HTH domain